MEFQYFSWDTPVWNVSSHCCTWVHVPRAGTSIWQTFRIRWNDKYQQDDSILTSLTPYQHNLVSVTSGVSSSSSTSVSLTLSFFVITSLMMLLYSVEQADSLSAISRKQLELLRNSGEKSNYQVSKYRLANCSVQPFLSWEFGVHNCVDVSRAPLAVTWKLFLFSVEEQLATNSSTQAIPRIMSL